MKKPYLIIGLACIVLGGAILLAFQLHEKQQAMRVAGDTATLAPVSSSTNPAIPAMEPQSLASTTSPAEVTAGQELLQPSINFEIVTTAAAQERGLGGRAAIPDNYAMLFVFPTDGTYGFWMKDMLVPIDMIWLSDTGTILKIDASVPADSYPAVYYPPQPVRYVLETKAGFAQEQNWTVGTQVALPPPY